MRSVQLHLTIPGKASAEVYQALTDLGHDLGWVPDPTEWELGFRHGLLHWVTDRYPAELTRSVSVFDGSWSCVDDGRGTAVTFAAHLQVGVGNTDAETLVVRRFLDDAVGVVAGMFDGDVRVDDIVIQPSRPVALTVA